MQTFKEGHHRKAYEYYHGDIPVDDFGRTYDIHHIDGDRSNNSKDNLIALTIQDHLEVHMDQGDYGACALIMKRMSKTPEQISAMTRAHNKKMVSEGTHPFTSELAVKRNSRRVSEGTHPWVGSDNSRKTNAARISDGSHNFLSHNRPAGWAPNPTPIEIDGVEYPSMKAAANSLGVPFSRIKDFVRTGRDPLEKRTRGGSCAKPVEYRGKRYNSIKQAAIETGTTVYYVKKETDSANL